MPVAPTNLKACIRHLADPLRLHTHLQCYNRLVFLKTAGLLENFPRAFLSVRGADQRQFLHNLVTHDIKGLPVGQGRPACLLDRQGKIRLAFIVHAFEQELILEMDPSFLETASEALNQYQISEKVELAALVNRWRVIPIHGPLSERLLRDIWPSLELPQISLAHSKESFKGGLELIVRWDLFQMPGLHLWVAPEAESVIRKKLEEAGFPLGLQSISSELFEVLRIEAGIPWPGKELSPSVILNELGNEDWVSFTKGCFVGQEIVARIKYRAHPPRLLTGLILETDAPPCLPAPIELEGKEAGVLTSACYSPSSHQVIGLGFLKYGLSGGALQVKSPAGLIPAQITRLPIESR